MRVGGNLQKAGTALAVGLLALAPTSAEAGAWMLAEGSGQIILGGLFASAPERFANDRGLALLAPPFEKASISAFAQYGLSDIVTLLGEFEIGTERDDTLPFAAPGMTAAGAGARVLVARTDHAVLSAQILARIEDSHGPAAKAVDPFHWTTIQLEPRLLAGYGFSVLGRSAFVEMQLGYRGRIEGTGADEIKLDVSAGYRLREDLLVLAQTFSTISADAILPYDYHKLQGSLVYDVSERWSVQAGAFTTLAGRNALREDGIVSALWFRF